jgi:hypothetical protein
MNQHDQDNLRFLLNSSPAQLKKWYQTADDNDLLYASELLERYGSLLDFEIMSSKVEKQLAAMPVLTEAQAVIAAVRD